MTDAAEVAYRAFCEARAGRVMPEAEYQAIRSRVELEWMRPVVAAVQELARRERMSMTTNNQVSNLTVILANLRATGWLPKHDAGVRAAAMREAHDILCRRGGSYESGIDLLARAAEYDDEASMDAGRES